MKTSTFIVLLAALQAPLAAQEAQPDAQSQIDSLRERVAALEGAPAPASLSAFNPAIGMALDSAYMQGVAKGAFSFRAAELGLEAPVDPYLKGWGVITGSPDGFEVEEAAGETTALPYGLTARGGRFFASFGRLAHFHDHELPVVERPRSLDSFIGGETRADGAELSWLAPAGVYINATAGVYDKMGAENGRVADGESLRPSQLTYLGRVETSLELGENHTVDAGASCAYTPRRIAADNTGSVTARHGARTLSGVDLTYRYQPSAGGLYNGLVWGTEVMRNDELSIDEATALPAGRHTAYGGYSYLQLKAGLKWRPGVMIDISQELGAPSIETRTATAFVTYDVTEFQRLRLEYSDASTNHGGPSERRLGLQWTIVIGKHVHGFRDR